MDSAQTTMWDPRPPSKNASSLPSPPSNVRLSHVTSATPAKRITFYKSGDNQFGGVRMAVHKRSFKCFDALLDDLSQKVPLPFGVRTVTTPRGTNTIRHLEQLQDGGCYLCSDRRYTKPVNMDLASKRPGIWYHHSHRPHRPESYSATPPNHLPHRQRRILLVKNSEPGVRRSVVLSRRSTRSLRVFLDEVSEVMQFHVRKLYTAEGRKIDSVQSLLNCPGVLVCVGREAFSPMLVNLIKKNSEEKLPGLDSRSPGLGTRTPGNGARSPATQGARSPPHGDQSRASEYSEGPESKKNVNFGLETKKSIIHPRSDSSNRSTHFSMSSEKSYNISAFSQARPAIMNDDIEKRVLVNKDGSLSVEMRVRFRLHNDETLQWSTQIKKSPSLTNDCCPLNQVPPHYLHKGQSESCSDPESMSFDPEGVDYSSHPLHCALESTHCPCCYQQQEQHYDLWENPIHAHKRHLGPPPHQRNSSHAHTILRHTNSSSSSSSCNSRRVVRCRAQLSSCGGGSGSEKSQLIQEEMCVTEQLESRVEVEQDGDTHVEVCHSRTEVVTIESNLRPADETMVEEDGERPLSAVSSSSNVLQELKEDQDNEEEELPPSASRCSHGNEASPSLHERSSSKNSRKEKRASCVASAASSCCCGSAVLLSPAEEEVHQDPEVEGAANVENDKRGASGLSGHTGHSGSNLSVCTNCGGCKRASSNPPSPLNNQEDVINAASDYDSGDSAVSTQSNKSNLTNCGRVSAISNVLEDRACSKMSRASNPEGKAEERATSATSQGSKSSRKSHVEEERSPSATSAKSGRSHCSGTAGSSRLREEAEGGNTDERAVSSLSQKSGVSAKSGASVGSHKSGSKSKVASPTAIQDEDDPNRPSTALSAKSKASAKSSSSHRSSCSRCAEVKSPGANEANELVTATGQEEGENRAASAMSAKSNLSVKSNNSHKSSKASERSLSPRSEAEGEGEERTASQTLNTRSVQSNASGKSAKSCKSKCHEDESEALKVEEEEETPQRAESAKSQKEETEESAEDRAASFLSGKSASSAKAHADAAEDRAASAVSRKSNASSSKSPKSNSVAPNAEEQQNESEERVPSAMSVKSKSSARSSVSHKNLEPAPQGPNAVTITTPEGVDEEGNKTAERALSAASAKSGKCNGSPKTPVAPCTPQSPKRLQPGSGETRGPSALSVRSVTSAKSGRSKCSCRAGQKVRKEKEEDVSDQAASVVSSSSKRQRRESGGTEQLSRCSSGSVSLGLPEDQETADSDSGKSGFSVCTQSKSRAKMAASNDPSSPSASALKENTKSNAGDLTLNPPAVTIDTPGADDDNEEGGGHDKKPVSPVSAKSSRSHTSLCSCGDKAGNDPQTLSRVDDHEHKDTSSIKSAKVRSKSSASASKVSANVKDDPANRESGEEDNASDKIPKSPFGLRPESAASAQSRSKTRASKQSKGESVRSNCLNPAHRGQVPNESPLSHSLSAADLLKETMAARPHSSISKVSKTSGKSEGEKSERCQRKKSPKEKMEDLTPGCLPNATPNEVVNDWLRSIPPNSNLLALGDEVEEGEQNKEEAVQEEESPEGDKVEEEEEEGKPEVEEDGAAEEQQSPATGDETCPNNRLSSGDSLPKNLHSSVAVMKVLLSSSLGRCRSMPEVSPVYGRRLSTSAQGLLDCLAQLHLIQPAAMPGSDLQKTRNQQYEEIMTILESLWLAEPFNMEATKVIGKEQVSPPRSSSGVGMSSGSAGSGKENVNQNGHETPPKEIDSLHKEEKEAEKVEEEGEEEEEQVQSTVPQSLDSPKATESPSSGNSSSKSPTDNDTRGDASSETPSTVLRAPLSKKQSHDPDPVWVLHLLKKLEEQFISHYMNAMAEFKVRWDLDDSLILNTMISELRDEVSQRIQGSIEREIRKIQTRAGRGRRTPRPPQGANLSRESTTMEKRRRMLKVMKNQSVKTTDSLSDGETTGDFSDQRSDDEYCPCDACVRKKMAARPLKTRPVATEAPVMMEFDLRKILQLKKSPEVLPEPEPPKPNIDNVVEEGRSLEVVQEEEEEEVEEEEETKEDIKAEVVLEEVIPEEHEEEDGTQSEDEDNKGEEKEGEKEEEEEDDKGEVECQCQCAENDKENVEEEKKDEAGDEEEKEKEEEEEEAGTGEDEEMVKEATAGEEETTENDEDTEEKKDVHHEEGETSTGQEEEEEGDDSATAEDEEGGECGGNEEEEGSEEQEGASPQGVTEGEEADVEDSDTKSPSADEVEQEVAGRGDEVVDEEEEEKEEKEEGNKKEEGALLHQFTRTSVESQPGSLEDVRPDSPPNPVSTIKVPKDVSTGGGGGSPRRSRSPARIKRRNPKQNNMELDDL